MMIICIIPLLIISTTELLSDMLSTLNVRGMNSQIINSPTDSVYVHKNQAITWTFSTVTLS